MNDFRIKIGNIVADVQSKHSYIKRICEEYWSPVEPNCRICIDSDILNKEREAIALLKNVCDFSPEDTQDWFLEVYALLHEIIPKLPEYNMLFIHGSAIQYMGKAYIFVAPSGTGKSTHTRLWKEHYGDEVTVINDDKPFLSFREDEVYLCGTPWRGKHNIGQNLEVILGGICILSQGKENSISKVTPADAVQDIIQQCNLSLYKQNVLQALDLIDKLLSTVPIYRLACTPTAKAVEVCHNEIIK